MSSSMNLINTTEEQLEAIRARALRILNSLDHNSKDEDLEDPKVNTTTTSIRPTSNNNIHDSWIRGETSFSSKSAGTGNDYNDESTPKYPTSRCQYFDKNGFFLIKSFSNKNEIISMKNQMQALVNEQWDPNNKEKKITIFRTDDKQIDHQGSDDYFLESANRIHFFAESKAMDENGKLKCEFWNDKMAALNKAGHGLHMVPGAFHDYTKSEKIRTLVMELGWRDPVVPQSMYIFKQARVGAEVTSHQDSSFLYTSPRQSCLGLWLALDEATLKNGCLWVRPRSHREKVRRIFKRNPDHFGKDSIKNRSNIAKGDVSKSQMIFIEEINSKPIPWDGGIPGGNTEDKEIWDSLFDAGFIPVECNAGDLLVFPGELDHLSLPNFSDNQRHTFQLHLVEGEGAGITWSETNWLQYPKHIPFLSLIDVSNCIFFWFTIVQCFYRNLVFEEYFG